MYDETYGVIYEIIARKFRAFMEPFWDLKIGIYVEYLTHVSSEYINTSQVLLSLTSKVDVPIMSQLVLWVMKTN